jgi:hypothetical protein
MDSSGTEQITNMKFCSKLGKTAIETPEMCVRIYEDDALGQNTVHK